MQIQDSTTITDFTKSGQAESLRSIQTTFYTKSPKSILKSVTIHLTQRSSALQFSLCHHRNHLKYIIHLTVKLSLDNSCRRSFKRDRGVPRRRGAGEKEGSLGRGTEAGVSTAADAQIPCGPHGCGCGPATLCP